MHVIYSYTFQINALQKKIYILPSRSMYDLFVIFLPFLIFKHRGNIYSLLFFLVHSFPTFQRSLITETASKFFTDSDVMFNQHKNRIHIDIHTRILILVPSDFHSFTVSICRSFSNKNFVSCLRAAAPYLKNYEKSSFVEFY